MSRNHAGSRGRGRRFGSPLPPENFAFLVPTTGAVEAETGKLFKGYKVLGLFLRQVPVIRVVYPILVASLLPGADSLLWGCGPFFWPAACR